MKRRYGQVIGLKPEKVEEYKKLHSAIWPDARDKIKKSNLRNFSIYLSQFDDGNYYLFSYFEYIGSNFSEDVKEMAADPAMQKWWSVCMPCQIPSKNRKNGEWWTDMEEVFHCD